VRGIDSGAWRTPGDSANLLDHHRQLAPAVNDAASGLPPLIAAIEASPIASAYTTTSSGLIGDQQT